MISFSNHEVDEIHSDTFDLPNANFTVLQKDFETGGIFGGVGIAGTSICAST